MHWNAQLQLIANLDRNRLTVAVQVRALGHHMQCVEQLSHEEKLNLLLQRAQLKRHPSRGGVIVRSGLWKTHINQ